MGNAMKMKLNALIILALLIQGGLANAKGKLIELPCQGGAVLIQPNLKTISEGFGVYFVATWGSSPPYVLISGEEGEYKAEVTTNYSTVGNKYIGYAIAKTPDIKSIQFDGCQIKWGKQQ